MSLSMILNVDNPPSRLSPFPQHDQHRLYRDDGDVNKDRPSKRRRTVGESVTQPEQSWQSPQSPSTDLEECPDLWREELDKYMLETRLRARQVEQWFEEKCQERNAELARYIAHDYETRAIPPHDRSVPPRPRSASIDRDILRTLNDTPPPPTNGHSSYAEEFHDLHFGVQNKGKRRPDAGVHVKTEQDHTRKRKFEDPDDLSDATSSITLPVKKKGGRQPKSVNRDEKPPRKRAAHKPKTVPTSAAGSKLPSEEPDLHTHLHAPTPHLSRASPSVAGSIIGISYDVTPIASTPSSPAFTAISLQGTAPGFWPVNEPIPPLKKPKKVDQSQAVKRVVALEEAQRRVWINIARKDIVRVYKYHASGYVVKCSHYKRLAGMAASQARKSTSRQKSVKDTTKSAKENQTRAKRLMREMLVFWKKNEREERDVRKKAEKEAVDRAKEEEEKREAARHARKLEFLISQTELYSHFVGNKLKTAEAEKTPDDDAVEEATRNLPPGAEMAASNEPLEDLDFDSEDQTNLFRHAARNAQDAIQLARNRARDFDKQTALERMTSDTALDGNEDQGGPFPDAASGSAPIVDLDSDELNFQNPTSLKEMTIPQPRILMAQLKEYQLKGLNWLATLYEQGINGILADEMGLGKTVQSISLLAYLAETHDIWGPFLVIAPASTLHNWQQEISRFVPALRALPYWGNVKDRATLRKFWYKQHINYTQDTPFHVVITSYPLIVQDDKYFQTVKWQYMVLDEAQAIKSSVSARWKTLLNFQCRNRLLLTGTPVQNSMQELWALLHFIMPSLFDSHDEFSEWFSKDIENAAENKGGKLNEYQLRRLHMILKPFMLRRVKRHVQNELSDKIEIDIYCDLSPRQRALYRGLRANISVAELLQKAANIGDADSAMSLMNLVMQFRKVCNHPELFERSDVVAPFSFCTFGRSRNIAREGDILDCPYSTENPVKVFIPELFWLDGGLLNIPGERTRAGFDTHWLYNLLSIWSTDYIVHSLKSSSGSFSFAYFLGLTSQRLHTAATAGFPSGQLASITQIIRWKEDGSICSDSEFSASINVPFGILPPRVSSRLEVAEYLPALHEIGSNYLSTSYLSRADIRWYSEPVMAPPIMIECSSRACLDKHLTGISAPLATLALYGLPDTRIFSEESVGKYHEFFSNLSPLGLFRTSPAYQLPWSPMKVPEGKRLIYDSTKLARLDLLLQELKAGDHRVLIYFQMTKMMDLMEEYLIYRQYKYLRLDGSSKLEDRRDMVFDWQTRPDIFIFLLSTRAGGLGINLTAADTVIFYDNDWNPSNDAQAMDRAHRLGQTRQVTVYRLITKGTIDERIVQLARVKKDVQDIVVGNKQFTEATKPSEIVSLLLNDEELANLGNAPSAVDASVSGAQPPAKLAGKQPESSAIRDLWNEEGDAFFGQSNATTQGNLGMDADDDMTPPPLPEALHLTKRKGRTGAKRGRKKKIHGGI